MEGVATKALADLALQGAGWTVAVLLAVIVTWLALRYMSLLERVIVVAETNRAASDARVKAHESVKTDITAVADAMQEMSREVEGKARETRHSFNNLSAIVQGAVVALDKLSRNVQANAGALDRLLNQGRSA